MSRMLRICIIFLLGLASFAFGRRPCSQSGFYRDPENCQQFYRCVNWYGNSFSSFQFSCPLGTAFDESISVCNHISLVSGCSKSEPLLVSLPTPEASASAPLQKPFTPPFTAPSPPVNTPGAQITTNPFLTTSKRPFTPPRSTTLTPITSPLPTTESAPKTTRPFVPLFNEPLTDVTSSSLLTDVTSSSLLTDVTSSSLLTDVTSSSLLTDVTPEPSSSSSNSSYKVDSLSLYQCPEPGFYPYEKNCNEFYVCQEVLPGILISEQLYSCPMRYLFDPKTSRCQRASKVTCSESQSEDDPQDEELSAKTNILVVHEQFLDLFFSTPLNYYSSKYYNK